MTTQRKVNRRKTKANLKKKKPTIAQLKKKLWTIFSQYIRLKDADSRGVVKCCTCDVKLPWKHPKGKMQCGHFFPKKGYPNLYYDECNTAPQCAACNGFLEGAQYFYSLHIIDKYGKSKLNKLVEEAIAYRKNKKPYRWNRAWLDAKIVEYSEKLKKEKLKRNIK